MIVKKPSLLILLGGMWHDFDGFAVAMKNLYEGHGYRVESTYDLDTLTHLDEAGYDMVLSYTCLSKHREGQDDSGPEALSDDQINGLAGWVQRGGGLLGAHAATVIGGSNPLLGKLFGAVFLHHPEPFQFTVYPLPAEHPMADGVRAFSIRDEFYIQKYDPSLDVHMVAIYEEKAYPMVWSKAEGLGRVAVVIPGHFREVWQDSMYQRLMLQTATWLVDRRRN